MISYNSTYRNLLWLVLISGLTLEVCGQRISFGTWAGSDITIRPVSVNTLDFGNLIKGSGNPKEILKQDATAFEVIAPEGYDLTVVFDSPVVLTGPGTSTIPFSLRFAYSNQGLQTIAEANPSAVEVPTGFTSITFPVLRSATGVPTPPPAPPDGSTTPDSRIKATAYLFIYGSAGPAASNADSGEYTGDINIIVDYSSY